MVFKFVLGNSSSDSLKIWATCLERNLFSKWQKFCFCFFNCALREKNISIIGSVDMGYFSYDFFQYDTPQKKNMLEYYSL